MLTRRHDLIPEHTLTQQRLSYFMDCFNFFISNLQGMKRV
jgi:hypothetical protein